MISNIMSKTIVVLPTYNEIENLELMVDSLLSLDKLDLNVLVVDDNSPDGTGKLADALATKHQKRVYVLHRTKKGGLGPAYIAGFGKALSLGANYIIQMDTDFSHDPKYIPNMVQAAKDCDLVIASRYVKDGGVDVSWSFYRKALSWLANMVYTPMVLNFPVHDATSGYRLWKSQTLKQINLDKITSSGYVFQIEMAYATYKKGLKIVEVPIYFPDRQRGTSKMGSHIVMEAAVRVWELKFRYSRLGQTKYQR